MNLNFRLLTKDGRQPTMPAVAKMLYKHIGYPMVYIAHCKRNLVTLVVDNPEEVSDAIQALQDLPYYESDAEPQEDGILLHSLPRVAKNMLALHHPVPGDLWHEHFKLCISVIAVDDERIVYSDHYLSNEIEQWICNQVMKVCSRTVWMEMMCYKSPELPGVTWCDIFDKRRPM